MRKKEEEHEDVPCFSNIRLGTEAKRKIKATEVDLCGIGDTGYADHKVVSRLEGGGLMVAVSDPAGNCSVPVVVPPHEWSFKPGES